jgi:uncharacterized protein YjfI (DUF2170 family)
MSALQLLAQQLNKENLNFTANLLTEDVIQLNTSELEDSPIYISISDKVIFIKMDILPVSEVPEGSRGELDSILLRQNATLPLSAMSVDSKNYYIYGELSSSSSFQETLLEVDLLIQNSSDVMDDLVEYLGKLD